MISRMKGLRHSLITVITVLVQEKPSRGVLSAALEDCEKKLLQNGAVMREFAALQAKAGANRDYAISELEENMVKHGCFAGR